MTKNSTCPKCGSLERVATVKSGIRCRICEEFLSSPQAPTTNADTNYKAISSSQAPAKEPRESGYVIAREFGLKEWIHHDGAYLKPNDVYRVLEKLKAERDELVGQRNDLVQKLSIAEGKSKDDRAELAEAKASTNRAEETAKKFWEERDAALAEVERLTKLLTRSPLKD